MSPTQAQKLDQLSERLRELEKSHAVLSSEVNRQGWFIWGTIAGVGAVAIGLIVEMAKLP